MAMAMSGTIALCPRRVIGLSAVRCWEVCNVLVSGPVARRQPDNCVRKFIKSLVAEGRSEVYIFKSECEDHSFANCMDLEFVAPKVKFDSFSRLQKQTLLYNTELHSWISTTLTISS